MEFPSLYGSLDNQYIHFRPNGKDGFKFRNFGFYENNNHLNIYIYYNYIIDF